MSLTYLKNAPKPPATQSADAEAVAMEMLTYEQGGVNISEASMQKEFTKRPTFKLDRQLATMDAPAAPPMWTAGSARPRPSCAEPARSRFTPQGSEYITYAQMKRVKADPKLRDFAPSTK